MAALRPVDNAREEFGDSGSGKDKTGVPEEGGVMKKIRLLAPIATIMMVLLVSGALMVMAGTGRTSAAFVFDADGCGLEVHFPGWEEKNLNPGDTKSVTATVYNTEENPLAYFLTIVKTGGHTGIYGELKGIAGYPAKELEDVLEFTIRREGDPVPLFAGLLRDFIAEYGREDEDGRVSGLSVGTITGEVSDRLIIAVHFPEESGNEYQGAGLNVKFLFRAECEPAGKLQVRKFNDRNQNGVFDGSDTWIEGWRVRIQGDGMDEWFDTTVKLDLPPGAYTVTEETRSGWTNSTPRVVEVKLAAGAVAEVLLNGDGVWGDNEPAIDGWTVTIGGREHQTPVAAELDPGTYVVTEEAREGWTATTPPR